MGRKAGKWEATSAHRADACAANVRGKGQDGAARQRPGLKFSGTGSDNASTAVHEASRCHEANHPSPGRAPES